MKKLTLILLVLTCLGACRDQKGAFRVEGQITDAKGQMLYFEQLTLNNGVVVLDSVKLDDEGRYAFSYDTIANPEFYHLRLGQQFVTLALHGEPGVRVDASAKNLSLGYTVEGSATNDSIRLIAQKFDALKCEMKKQGERQWASMKYLSDRLDTLVEHYKEEVKRDFIQNNFSSPLGYYACMQTLNGTPVFDPQNSKSDFRWIQAVANGWNEAYPGAPRTQQLLDIVKTFAPLYRPAQDVELKISGDKVRELGIIDMTMKDLKGEPCTLSSLRGQVVLLDFTAYELVQSVERNMLLREIYDRYHDRGLEIYQVSVDANRSFWHQRASQLPWKTVFCEEGIHSDMLRLYMVDRLPYYFLIDRNCDLQARMENIADLEKAIEELL